MERVFLDANVLFSASWRPHAGLLRLWKLPDVRLVTSEYALNEAHYNLDSDEQRRRLDALAASLEVVSEPARAAPLPDGITLPDKDQPILRGAIRERCSFLITGDLRHFGEYFGRTVAGVTILRPADFLRRRGG